MFYAGLASSAFSFDFGRIPHKTRRPLKDMIGSSKHRNSSDSSPTEWYSGNGNKLVSELQLKYQSQQEELEKLKKDLLSQKVIKPSGKVRKNSTDLAGDSEFTLCGHLTA